MKLKTRTNFYSQYSIDDAAMYIHKPSNVFKVSVTKSDYKIFLTLLGKFHDSFELNLGVMTEREKQLLKVAIDKNLIEVSEESNDSFLIRYLENKYENWREVYHKIERTELVWINVAEYLSGYTNDKIPELIHEKKRTQRIVFLEGHEAYNPLEGDLCFFIEDDSISFYINGLKRQVVPRTNYQSSKLLKNMIPYIIFCVIIETINEELAEDTLLKFSSDGSRSSILLNSLNDTLTQSAINQELIKIDSTTRIEKIQKLERMYLSLQNIKIEINKSFALENQLNVAQYSMECDQGIRQISYDFSYKLAAENGLTEFLEFYLNHINKDFGESIWISEDSFEKYIIRGFGGAIEKNEEDLMVEWINFNENINEKLDFIQSLLKQPKKVRILGKDVFDKKIWRVKLMYGEDLVYSSKLTVEVEKEIMRGLAFIASTLINGSSLDSVEQHVDIIETEDFSLIDRLNISELVQKIQQHNLFSELKIEPWILQNHVQEYGLIVGKFSLK